MKRIAPFYVACLLFVGCTSAQFAPASLMHRYDVRTPYERIEIFRSERPAKKFMELGTATACCARDAPRLVELLQKKASDSGGDGLMDFEFTAAGQATATVIRYRDF